MSLINKILEKIKPDMDIGTREKSIDMAIKCWEMMANNVFERIKNEWDSGKLSPEEHWELLNRIENKIKEHRDLVWEDISESIRDIEREQMNRPHKLKDIKSDSMEDFYNGESA